MRKTISLIMATYNGGRFLKEQLDSIYNQTLVPDEVIVCDDCSSDSTVEILAQYARDKGLRYEVNSKSLGVNENFYKALSLATCDYIAICDQDDIWLPQKIEISYKSLCKIDDGAPCIVSSLCNSIDANGNPISNLKDNMDTQGYLATYLNYESSQGCSLMMNRTLLNKILENKAKAQGIIYDGFISFTAATLGHKYNIGKRLMLYRHHDKNVIARASNGRDNLKNRILRKDTLSSLFPNRRLKLFSLLLELYGNEIKDQEILLFLKKADKLYRNYNYINEMLFISSLKELSLNKRAKSIIYSSIIHLLKHFVR